MPKPYPEHQTILAHTPLLREDVEFCHTLNINGEWMRHG